MAKKDDLSPDALAPGPDDEGARLIVGILGDSGDADTVRVYLDLEFSRSYDVPRAAVLRRERLGADASPLGVESSAVWVAADTLLVLRQSKARRVEEEFLAGDFTIEGSFTPVESFAVVRPPRRSLDPDCDIGRTANPAFPSCAWKCPSTTPECQGGTIHPAVCGGGGSFSPCW